MSENRRGGVRRGLATIAFLKARFDGGMDHLGMFQPFVENAIQAAEVDEIELPAVQRSVQEATGLYIPADVVKTLLQRGTKKGLLRRHGGRYFRSEVRRESTELSHRIEELERVHQGLATNLRKFALEHGVELGSNDDALAALTGFLDANHIGIVLGQSQSTEQRNRRPELERVIAAFVALEIDERGSSYDALEGVVQGLIVQNALLLRDVPATKRHLDGLTVFFDTGVLIRALGYAGIAEQQVTNESLNLIRAAGARLCTFERTVNEVETILRVYEHRLGSHEGVRSLYPNSVTYHFLNTKATPSDIRQMIALLRESLSKLGVRIRDFPMHVPEYTENEKALGEMLTDPNRSGNGNDARVSHDVDAIAAILTLRAGARPKRVWNAKYVFVSGSPQTVSNATRWYRETYPSEAPPQTDEACVATGGVLRRTPAAAPLRGTKPPLLVAPGDGGRIVACGEPIDRSPKDDRSTKRRRGAVGAHHP